MRKLLYIPILFGHPTECARDVQAVSQFWNSLEFAFDSVKNANLFYELMGTEKSELSNALPKYDADLNKLLKERDNFIAKTINESLKEDEIGVLFLWLEHDVLPKLAKDIQVTELKERKKVLEYIALPLPSLNSDKGTDIIKYFAGRVKIPS